MTERNDIRMSRIQAVLDVNMALDRNKLWRVVDELRDMDGREYKVAADILTAVLEIRFGKR